MDSEQSASSQRSEHNSSLTRGPPALDRDSNVRQEENTKEDAASRRHERSTEQASGGNLLAASSPGWTGYMSMWTQQAAGLHGLPKSPHTGDRETLLAPSSALPTGTHSQPPPTQTTTTPASLFPSEAMRLASAASTPSSHTSRGHSNPGGGSSDVEHSYGQAALGGLISLRPHADSAFDYTQDMLSEGPHASFGSIMKLSPPGPHLNTGTATNPVYPSSPRSRYTASPPLPHKYSAPAAASSYQHQASWPFNQKDVALQDFGNLLSECGPEGSASGPPSSGGHHQHNVSKDLLLGQALKHLQQQGRMRQESPLQQRSPPGQDRVGTLDMQRLAVQMEQQQQQQQHWQKFTSGGPGFMDAGGQQQRQQLQQAQPLSARASAPGQNAMHGHNMPNFSKPHPWQQHQNAAHLAGMEQQQQQQRLHANMQFAAGSNAPVTQMTLEKWQQQQQQQPSTQDQQDQHASLVEGLSALAAKLNGLQQQNPLPEHGQAQQPRQQQAGSGSQVKQPQGPFQQQQHQQERQQQQLLSAFAMGPDLLDSDDEEGQAQKPPATSTGANPWSGWSSQAAPGGTKPAESHAPVNLTSSRPSSSKGSEASSRTAPQLGTPEMLPPLATLLSQMQLEPGQLATLLSQSQSDPGQLANLLNQRQSEVEQMQLANLLGQMPGSDPGQLAALLSQRQSEPGQVNLTKLLSQMQSEPGHLATLLSQVQPEQGEVPLAKLLSQMGAQPGGGEVPLAKLLSQMQPEQGDVPLATLLSQLQGGPGAEGGVFNVDQQQFSPETAELVSMLSGGGGGAPMPGRLSLSSMRQTLDPGLMTRASYNAPYATSNIQQQQQHHYPPSRSISTLTREQQLQQSQLWQGSGMLPAVQEGNDDLLVQLLALQQQQQPGTAAPGQQWQQQQRPLQQRHSHPTSSQVNDLMQSLAAAGQLMGPNALGAAQLEDRHMGLLQQQLPPRGQQLPPGSWTRQQAPLPPGPRPFMHSQQQAALFPAGMPQYHRNNQGMPAIALYPLAGHPDDTRQAPQLLRPAHPGAGAAYLRGLPMFPPPPPGQAADSFLMMNAANAMQQQYHSSLPPVGGRSQRIWTPLGRAGLDPSMHPGGQLGCDLCRVLCNSPVNLEQHLASRKHVARAARLAAAVAAAAAREAQLASGQAFTGEAEPGGSHNAVVHSLCRQMISSTLNTVTTELLLRIKGFQDHAVANSVVKAAAHRWYVCGLREVRKAVKLQRACSVVVAPNIEQMDSVGSLDDHLQDILDLCNEQGVPVIFALTRKRLGQIYGCRKRVSAVALFDRSGVEELHVRMVELMLEGRTTFERLSREAGGVPPVVLLEEDDEDGSNEEGQEGGMGEEEGQEEARSMDRREEGTLEGRLMESEAGREEARMAGMFP